MLGTVVHTNSKGWFIVESRDPLGFISKWFGLKSKIIRNPEFLAVGSVCEFEVSGEPLRKPDGYPLALRINFIRMADGQKLDSSVLQGGAK